MAAQLTPSQIKALLWLEPNTLYDFRTLHGLVRDSLWRLKIIDKLSGSRTDKTRPQICLTSFGSEILAVLRAVHTQ